MKKQQGRSMIEMIGVLAIIGILSIGSLWGLNKAYTKNNANNLIEDARMSGFLVIDEIFETLPEEEISLNDRFSPLTNYPLTAYKETDTSFAVIADNVPYNVCEETKSRKTDWTEDIIANDEKNTCDRGQNNTVMFFMNVLLSSQKSKEFCRKDSDCGECGSCQNANCFYQNGAELKGTNGNCYQCSASKTSTTSSKEACSLCPKNTRFYVGNQEKCYSCDIATVIGNRLHTTKEECMRCDNRYWTEGDTCFVCNGNVVRNGTACEWNCSENYVGEESGCKPCVSGTATYRMSSLNSCRQCSNRFYAGQTEYGGYCYLCSQLSSAGKYTNWVRKADCLKCPNTYWRTINGGSCWYCSGTVSSDGLSCITE